MATTARIKYGSAGTVTITLDNLAANQDSNPSVGFGRQSTVVDNSSNVYQDILIGGKVTGPTFANDGSLIKIWAFGSYDGTVFPPGLGSTDADIDFGTNLGTFAYLDEVQTIIMSSDADVTYVWGPVSLANAFGGSMPLKWGIVVQYQDSAGNNLAASGHEMKYTPIQYEDL